MRTSSTAFVLTAALVVSAAFLGLPERAQAHCDTLDGPVVTDAQAALDKGDIAGVLKWVKPEAEAEIRQAFARALKVRGLSADARKLADLYFFETVVRVHRAGEGAPYTGLRPAGAEVDPGIAAADKSLTTGKVAPVTALVAGHVTTGISERFELALELRQHMNESVEKGREYVEAYVVYIHYVEGILASASGTQSAHEGHAAEAEVH